MPNAPTGGRAVERQIVLPFSRAVEIAYKNVRMRLSRSLLVTSGIVLAIAFLMSIQASDTLVTSMRDWMHGVEKSPRFAELRAQKEGLDAQLKPVDTVIHKCSGAEADPRPALGSTTSELKEEFGIEAQFVCIAVGAGKVEEAKQWLALKRKLKPIESELGGPNELAVLFSGKGVPTEAKDVAASSVQTTWVLGLALLVAFVGILNSMLMSVTERFREIGTMKCLGALDSFIVKLFLIESMFQGIVGTVLGIIVGMGLSVGSLCMSYGAYTWKAVPYGALANALGICFAVGVGLTVGAAVYPAWQAARMQPIEAMRADT